MRSQNLYDGILPPASEEQVTELSRRGPVRVERIVSHGHSSPPGFWYEQEEDEWVLVLRGAARLEYESGATLALGEGDSVEIPAHQRHRVAWTDPHRETVWLALFWR